MTRSIIWARVTHGIEWVAAAEASLLPGVSKLRAGHRDLIFECSLLQDVQRLRCVDDLHVLWSDLAELGLDHTRASLATLEAAAYRLPTPPLAVPPWARAFRITASMLGPRNYTRFKVEETLGPVLSGYLGLPFLDSRSAEADGLIWCRIHLFDGGARLSLRTDSAPLHRRDWRTRGLAGALHPPVAAAMALVAQLEPGLRVLGPFAGFGTLLVEAGLRCRGLVLRGTDVDPAAIEAAKVQGDRAGVALEAELGDASAVRPSSVDRVLSNPP